MIDKIQDHLLDILEADARVYRGGNSYTGWAGIVRVDPDTPVVPVEGKVNLFEDVFEPDATDTRPAIYLGHKNNEATDEEDFIAINGGLIWYRVLKLPLVIICHGTNKRNAKRQRNQLRANVLYILIEHLIEAGYWWQMTIPGAKRGGDMTQKLFASSSGQAGQGVYPAGCVIPLEIHYSFARGGTDA